MLLLASCGGTPAARLQSLDGAAQNNDAQQEAGPSQSDAQPDATQPDGAIDAQPADAALGDAAPACIAQGYQCTDSYGRGCCSGLACGYGGTQPGGQPYYWCAACDLTGLTGGPCCLDGQGTHLCAYNYECRNFGSAGTPQYRCISCSSTPTCCNMRDYPC